MGTGQIEVFWKILDLFEHSAIYPGREAFVRDVKHALLLHAPRFDAHDPAKDCTNTRHPSNAKTLYRAPLMTQFGTRDGSVPIA